MRNLIGAEMAEVDLDGSQGAVTTAEGGGYDQELKRTLGSFQGSQSRLRSSRLQSASLRRSTPS
jgi:hypothetical protein